MVNENVTNILRTQLPVYFRPIIEFQEILKAHGYALQQIGTEMKRIWDNFYLVSCDGQTLSYYENLIGLSLGKDTSLSLEERRSIAVAQYAMRPLYTFRVLKEMLASAVGPESYYAECLYDRYQLIVKVIDQDIQKVRELYGIIAIIRPAHMATLVYAEYRGEVFVSIRKTAAITFLSVFYPRLNIPKLFLDSTWKLDGTRKLSGYDGYGRLDFYPVGVRFQDGARGTPQEKPRYRIVAGAREGPEAGSAVSVRIQAECKAAETERVRIQASAEAGAGTGDIQVYNRNQLDGIWRLDGRRKLNGGVSVL